MATATNKSSRQQELERAAAIEQRHRNERDRLANQVDELDAQIRGYREERAAIDRELQEHHATELASGTRAPRVRELRERKRTLQSEIEHALEVREVAFAQLHGEANDRHLDSFRAMNDAQQAVNREQCEQLLLRFDALCRELEEVWAAAWGEATTLELAGDGWGQAQLRRIRGDLTSVHYVGRDGWPTLLLPHFPGPE